MHHKTFSPPSSNDDSTEGSCDSAEVKMNVYGETKINRNCVL